MKTALLFLISSLPLFAQKITDLPATNAVNPAGLLNVAVPLGGTNRNQKVRVDDLRGYVTVRDFGARGGTNDDTEAFQLAFDYVSTNRRPLHLETTNYTLYSTVRLTNNVYLDGNGASVFFERNASGDMFASYGCSNVVVQNLNLFGATNLAAIPAAGSRNGMFMQSGDVGQSLIFNVSFNGFSGNGLYFWGHNSFSDSESNNVMVSHCRAYACNIGFLTGIAAAEYFTFENCVARLCAEGISVGSGNCRINGGEFTGNVVGVRIKLASSNQAHSLVNGATLNHNTFPVIMQDFAASHLFANCLVYGGGTVVFSNCTGGTFQGGVYAPTTTIVYGGGANSGMNYLCDVGINPSTGLPITKSGGGLLNVMGTHDMISTSANQWSTNDGNYQFSGTIWANAVSNNYGYSTVFTANSATNGTLFVSSSINLNGGTITKPSRMSVDTGWDTYRADLRTAGFNWMLNGVLSGVSWTPALGIVQFETNVIVVGDVGLAGVVRATNGIQFQGALALTNGLKASAALQFAALPANASTNMTLTCTGAAAGDLVIPGIPPSAFTVSASNVVFSMWPTQDLVIVRAVNAGPGAATFNSATFKAAVIKVQ